MTPVRALDSWRDVGRRVAATRAARGLTQTALAEAIGLERTALAKIEAGSRGLSALELARLADALERPIESFVAESLPAVVSRRAQELDSTRQLDLVAQDFAREVQLLLDLGTLKPVHLKHTGVPSTFQEIEALAAHTRKRLKLKPGPVLSLDSAAEALGLYVLVQAVGKDAGEGAYLSLDEAGATVINGSQPSGRRRYTLAHEMGHHIMGDEYVTDWELDRPRDETEKRINAFAIHFLMPRASVARDWDRLGGTVSPREAAIRLAQEYRVSWTAVCSQLVTMDLIDHQLFEDLRRMPPTKAEHLELGGVLYEDLIPPRVSPRFAQAVVRAYRANKLTSSRAVELLHGAVSEEDLPAVDEVPVEALTSELT